MPPNLLTFFREQLYPSGGHLEIRAIDQTNRLRPSRQRAWDTQRPIQTWNSYGYNLYFGVQPRNCDTFGGAKAIDFYVCLIGDFDDGDRAGAALARMEEVGLPPSIVVASGRPGAIHTYHLLRKPIRTQLARPVAQDWCEWLGSDSVYDPPRILRIPGTTNWKEGAGECEIVTWEPERRYSLARITSGMIEGGWTPPEQVEQRGHSEGGGTPLYAPTARATSVSVAIATLPGHLRSALRTGDAAGYAALSHRDMALMRGLVRAGLTPRRALKTLRASAAGNCIERQYAKGVAVGDAYVGYMLDKVRDGDGSRHARRVNGADVSTVAIDRLELVTIPGFKTRALRVHGIVKSGPLEGQSCWMGWLEPTAILGSRTLDRWVALAASAGLDAVKNTVQGGDLMRALASVGGFRALLLARDRGFVPMILLPKALDAGRIEG